MNEIKDEVKTEETTKEPSCLVLSCMFAGRNLPTKFFVKQIVDEGGDGFMSVITKDGSNYAINLRACEYIKFYQEEKDNVR